jgi:CheY-like chemotaxis protein
VGAAEIARIRAAGMEDYIAKPVVPRCLHQVLSRLSKTREAA